MNQHAIAADLILNLSNQLRAEVTNVNLTKVEIDKALEVAAIALPAYEALCQVGGDQRTAVYWERNLMEDEKERLQQARHCVRLLTALRTTL